MSDNIKGLQQRLYDLGYLTGDRNKAVDGISGKNTRAAIEKAKADGYNVENGKLVMTSNHPFQQTQDRVFSFVNKARANEEKALPKTKAPYDYTDAQKKTHDTYAKQQELYNLGYLTGDFEKAVDGKWGSKSQAALNAAIKAGHYDKNGNRTKQPHEAATKGSTKQEAKQSVDNKPTKNYDPWNGKYPLDYVPTNKDLVKQFFGNALKNPFQAAVDAQLYLQDRMGAPSNMMTSLRDWQISVPHRIKSAAVAAVRKPFNSDKSYDELFSEELSTNRLANTPILGTITPLPLTNENFTEEQLDFAKRAVHPNGAITSGGKNAAKDGRYAPSGTLKEYLTNPDRVFQTTIGNASGRNGITSDIFDINTEEKTKGAYEKHNDDMYIEMAKKGDQYGGLRTLQRFLGSTDIMPDNQKIRARLNLTGKK
jgi:hypothetical protein